MPAITRASIGGREELGRFAEIGGVDEVFERPAHPYTQALLSAIPLPDPRKERQRRRIVLQGDLPNPADPPSGCRFRTRCQKFASELTDEERTLCLEQQPPLLPRTGGPDHLDACHYAQRRGNAIKRTRGIYELAGAYRHDSLVALRSHHRLAGVRGREETTVASNGEGGEAPLAPRPKTRSTRCRAIRCRMAAA